MTGVILVERRRAAIVKLLKPVKSPKQLEPHRPTSPTPIVSEVAENMVLTEGTALGMDAAPPPACAPHAAHKWGRAPSAGLFGGSTGPGAAAVGLQRTPREAYAFPRGACGRRTPPSLPFCTCEGPPRLPVVLRLPPRWCHNGLACFLETAAAERVCLISSWSNNVRSDWVAVGTPC
ncbi:L1Tc protein [Trypanosoma rangeli]|uniref:L1Tc protein n=1 Tax=Trypanosoma rangeli TaxID=5698 RepID=A0A3R7JUR0_TRYRA|nr:L1Tc protein [Trypanosoma rangeli]RNE97152.1 L1Tc protein [Trypanosoma rangeli]|eukprot:RNE97152.1 L1Tc protein [Trypanosoma rangeli]